MLGVFPTEIILTVLSFLPLRQLHCLPQTSKEWNAFLHDNESSVYHFAAILHGFVSAHTSFRDARASNVPWLDDVQCWKDLCFKFYNRERRWEGNGLARSAVTYAAGESVWHFKIDEEQRTVITTHLDGGLRVSGIEDDRILWFLYPSEVHVYAHCEYASGFLVVTRMGQELEVWRRKRDFQTIPNHNLHTHQQISHSLSRQSELSVSQNDRGAFLPWKIIRAPNTVRALRLVHSTLLVASEAAQEAYLYDLNDTTNWRPKQTISLSSPDSPRALEISYIDLSPRNIFVCSTEDVLVYALDTTNAQASLKFPSQVRVFNELYETRAYRVSYSPDGPAYVPGGTKSSSLQECSLDLTRLVRRTQSDPIRNFHAVHVSPCGSHFATIDEQGCLCIVRNFEKTLRRGTSFSECITILDLHYPVMNLAFEEDKRIAVNVLHRGIFVVSFISENDVSVDSLTMQPQAQPRLLHAKQAICGLNATRICSCLQLTRSELWYSWTDIDDDDDPEVRARSRLNYINFTESQQGVL